MLEPIADAFSISVTELISGNTVNNANVSANIKKKRAYFGIKIKLILEQKN